MLENDFRRVNINGKTCIENTNPCDHSMYVAVKIYLNDHCTPIAECVTANGWTDTIEWNNEVQRTIANRYINGYTLIYDERPKRPFDEWHK